MENHLHRILLLLLLAPAFTLTAQNSPTVVLQDYDQTSLPAQYQLQNDTTFCKTQTLTIHGQNFKRATSGEAWDTTTIKLGGIKITPNSITTQNGGTNDRITLTLPTTYWRDTCLTIEITKRTVQTPDTFYYTAQDTICLTGDQAQITYPQTTYCIGDANPIPTITLSPNTTGQFCCQSGAASFTVFPTTGEIPIHLGAVNPNNQFQYQTNHPRCGDTINFTVAIQTRQPSTATVQMQTLYSTCQNGPAITPDQPTPNSGTFLSTTGLAIINPATGQFAPSLSPTGIHSLWYIPNQPCYDSTEIQILIQPQDNPNFTYPPNGIYCLGDPDPWPLITGTGGGTFTAITAGTQVDPNGQLHLQASGAGTHTIQYKTNGTCKDSSTTTVAIYGTASANFTYTSSQFCSADTNPIPQILGTPGGTFTSDSTLALNPATGQILLQQSQTGPHNITYTLTGSCQAQFTQTIQISPTDSTTMLTYLGGLYCQAGLDPIPAIIGDTLGHFTAGGGIVFANTDQGQLDLSAMLPGGPYVVYYDLDNRCATDPTDTIWIQNPDDATFSYPRSSYCEGGANPIPDRIDAPGGTFTEPTGKIVFTNTTTGEIDANQSRPGGPFFITYTTNGACPQSTTQQLSILQKPIGAQLTVAPDTTYCAGTNLTLQATAGGTTEWHWYKNNEPQTDIQDDLWLLDGTLGTDTVSITMLNAQGCKDSLTKILQGLPIPSVTSEVTKGETNALGTAETKVEFTTAMPNTTIDWSLNGTNVHDTHPTNGSLTAAAAGTDTLPTIITTLNNTHDPGRLTITLRPSTASCIGKSDTAHIFLNPQAFPVFVPEVMTPNGDGKNDTWLITCMPGINPADYRMLLFNRSGGQVLEMNGLHDQFNSNGLPDGVYLWVLQDRHHNPLQKGMLTIRGK
jgi:hypothetical protein